ncbi:MAG: beta-ketoacyl synthase N-terminal-like domain-containing protein, partial [Dolichospermum sp.]
MGGINLTFFPVIASRFANASLISADGLCKIFDANADGYVRGEGVGVVILKPLSQAQLESVPSQAKAEPNLSPLQIFTLTAKTSTALQALVQRYQAFLEDQPQASLVDICFMANTR